MKKMSVLPGAAAGKHSRRCPLARIVLLSIMMIVMPVIFTHAQESPYIPPKDPLVVQKLEQWKDLKFGLLMHWGTYSQWGIVESWSICPEDEGWTQRRGHGSENYFEYKQNYEQLIKTFNPVDFDPAKWAGAARDAGMRYVVFTTKHHDGFCMFDTHQTDYKITADDCPFHTNPKANVAKEVFNAFRQQDFMIGAYFSKPDWHSPYFWWPYFPPLDRHPNYDEAKYPARWQQFRDFTFNQLRELMSGEYGKIDILWLDGGWVRPHSEAEIRKNPRTNEDVDMPKIASMARSLQPGLIMVDRSVAGLYENYRTPEQQVPGKPLDYPWETCMTMGNSWSYVPHDHYKSAEHLVQLLIRIVSRGGNFLLNIGPDPQGNLDPVAYERLSDIGAWMKVNSQAIYASRPVAPYEEGNIVYTQSKDHHTVYAFYLKDSTHKGLPATVRIRSFIPAAGTRVSLLGSQQKLRWRKDGEGIVITIPEKIRTKLPCRYAFTFAIQPSENTQL